MKRERITRENENDEWQSEREKIMSENESDN